VKENEETSVQDRGVANSLIENRLLAVEKKLISLQMQKQPEVKKKENWKMQITLAIIVLLFGYWLGRM
jgi:K+ transporter